MAMNSTRAVNLAAVLSLLFGNYVMTINQVNVSSIFTFGPLSHAASISKDFDLSVYGLGILTSAFFLAYGAFEVPGGILAARMGPKKIVVMGTIANAFGVIGSALAPQFDALVLFRFVAGFGFAFAFPSMLVLIVRYYKAGSEGFGVALTSMAFAVGSVTGYFGWAVLGDTVGWRPALVVAGVLDIVGVLAMLALIPPDREGAAFKLDRAHLRSIIVSRPLAILSIAFLGVGSTYGLVVNFMIYYLEGNFGLQPGLAGSIASIATILTIFSAPVIGRVYDRVGRVKLLMVASAAVISLGVGIAAVDSIYAALVSVALCGLSAGGFFTVGLAVAREVSASIPEYESLSVGWVDCFSLLGNSISPLYFSALVLVTGYPDAWLVGGSVAIVSTVPVLFLKSGAFQRGPGTMDAVLDKT